jgi:hypothetical protein
MQNFNVDTIILLIKHNMPYFIGLLRLTPDNFTHEERENAGWVKSVLLPYYQYCKLIVAFIACT